MVTMNVISYEDERLGFFADQRRVVQKRYDRLEKQIKPDEPYTSERREFLSDLGRELSFYNDVIEMLEHSVVPKSEHDEALTKWADIADIYADSVDKWEEAYEELEVKFENVKNEIAKEIFTEIENILSSDKIDEGLKYDEYWGAILSISRIDDEINKLKEKYVTE